MAYPIAGLVKEYRPAGFPGEGPIIPHGLSVMVNAPAAFRFTAPAWPERHARAAELLGVDTRGMSSREAAGALADELAAIMRDLELPSGLAAMGYTLDDLPALVAGARKQQRLLVNSPRPVNDEQLAELFRASMHWS
jgi:alcohol dehydrogenase class IV